jgi:hypothetical protein
MKPQFNQNPYIFLAKHTLGCDSKYVTLLDKSLDQVLKSSIIVRPKVVKGGKLN